MMTQRAAPVDGTAHPASRDGLVLLVVFLVLAVGIITGGYSYYQNYERDFRAEAERQLLAIAALKVGELTQYRRERLEDAELFHHNSAFSPLVSRFLEHADDSAARTQLQTWLGKYQSNSQYDRVVLLDTQGAVRMAVPESSRPLAVGVLAGATECRLSDQVLFEDFYRDPLDQHVYLELLVPICDETDAERPLGVIALRINPANYLYPFLQHWPVPSATAETLLVRREGGEVVFLNELRFQKNTALNLRLPLANKDRPAVVAAWGREGIMEGRDYRNVPVIAATDIVPHSPWFMVARRDTAEVFAPMRARRLQVAVLIGSLLFGAGACIALIWRHQRVSFYRSQAKMEKAMRLAQATLQAAMDQSPVGIAVADAPAGVLRYVNDTGLLIRGGDREAIVNGIGIHRYVASWQILDLDGSELPAEAVPLYRAVVFGETGSREFFIRREDGEDRLVLAKAAPVRDVQGTVVAGIVVFMDITERKAADDQLRRTLANLQHSNQELEQFAYVASHDLQEPLRMVSSYVQLLAQRYEDQLDDKARKYIHYAVDGAIRMQTLINDLLAYSRVGLRGRPLEPTDAQAPLDEALYNLATLIEENQAVITHDVLPRVRADASQLALVFQNLIANAVKFRRPEIPRIHIAAQETPEAWVISVRDNGIGIEPQHAQRVFVIFQRLHTREEYPGTGIGLAVCQRIVARHNGKIWFESAPGQGSTFFFTVPK
jgi:PAS domain S-box-containing protein